MTTRVAVVLPAQIKTTDRPEGDRRGCDMPADVYRLGLQPTPGPPGSVGARRRTGSYAACLVVDAVARESI